MIPVVESFAPIVTAVETKLLTSLQAYDNTITGVHYLYGHPIEIIQRLKQRDESDEFTFKKYPLVALFQDFPEDHTGQIGIPAEISLHLIIARGTDPKYVAEERYAKNFKPVLYPIYEELLKQITLSKTFMNYGVSTLQHTKIDRLYWGKEGLYGNALEP